MSQKFNVGDRIRCDDAEGSLELRLGGMYVVEAVTHYGGLKLEGIYFPFSPHRFKLWYIPTEVHSGGPYVCISVYNELKKQNVALNDALELVKKAYTILQAEHDNLKKQNVEVHRDLATMQTAYIQNKRLSGNSIAIENISLRSRIKELEEELECLSNQ